MVTYDIDEGKSDDGRTRAGRHGVNAEATRSAILASAERLFRRRGYRDVTMRQIAADAGCSHTAIYRYFADKDALMEAIAAPVLEGLGKDFDDIATRDVPWNERVVTMCLRFVRFGLANRALFRLFFIVHAGRVDREPTGGRVNALRIGLFQKLRVALAEALDIDPDDEMSLEYARGLYYLLHGMIGTYEESAESDEALMARLEPVFAGAISSLIAGYRTHTTTIGG